MHFRVQTDEMNYGLGMVTRAISARPVKPVYDGVLIESVEDGLVLTCTDGEISIKATVSAIVDEDGTALLPARLFAEMMRNTSMACMASEDYPDIRDISGEYRAALPCNKFRDAVSRVQFAVSTDESRKILTGILMEVYEKETLLVGLDGFRLALQRMEAENEIPQNAQKDHLAAVTPGKILSEVSKMLPDTEEACRITFNSSHIMFTFGSVKVYGTLLTGEFIDYRKILPASWSTEALVNRSQFSDAIDRCSLMAREGKNNLIYLHLKPEAPMEMTANADRGEVHEELDVGFQGSELNIAFNSRYLTDIIHNIDDEQVRMCFNSNVSPCMIKPLEGEAFTFLVLPVRVFNK